MYSVSIPSSTNNLNHDRERSPQRPRSAALRTMLNGLFDALD